MVFFLLDKKAEPALVLATRYGKYIPLPVFSSDAIYVTDDATVV
jgi:hypothetical protein